MAEILCFSKNMFFLLFFAPLKKVFLVPVKTPGLNLVYNLHSLSAAYTLPPTPTRLGLLSPPPGYGALVARYVQASSQDVLCPYKWGFGAQEFKA